MEDERRDLERQIYQAELLKPKATVTKAEIEKAFDIIRKKLIKGDLENIKQLITVYVDRIEVYPDEVIIQFNYLPTIRFSGIKTNTRINQKIKYQKTKCLKKMNHEPGKQQLSADNTDKKCEGLDKSPVADGIGDRNKNSSQKYVSHFGGESGI